MQKTSSTQHAFSIWRDLLIIAIVLGLFFSLCLGCYALIAPDEARYCEIAREMFASRHFITPRLNGLLYFEKPVLFYWMQAASIRLFGLSEWAMRFWPACLAVMGCLLTYLLSLKLYSRKTALYACFILATSLLYFGLGHYVSLDMPVSIFLTGTLVAFLFATLEASSWKRRTYIYLAAICAACAVLTKGLIGFAFPAMIIGLWVLLLDKWKSLKEWFLPSSLFIFFIIVLPWHFLLQMKHPSFFHFYFIEQQFSRFSTMTADRYEPIYFYLVVLLLGFFPWSAFICQAMKKYWPSWKQRKQFENEIFLIIWFFAILVFFSLSNSKLIPYILPIFPPAAIITGRYFATVKTKSLGLKIGFMALFLLSIGISVFIYIAPKQYPVANPVQAKIFLTTLAISILLTTLSALILFFKSSTKSAFIALCLGTGIFTVTLLPAIPHIDHRSIKPLTTTLNTVAKPSDAIVSYKHYYQDFPFYMRQIVIVADCTNELDFGLAHQKDTNWMINQKQFWNLWNSSKRVFVITRNTDYADMQKEHSLSKFFVLNKTQRNILLCNQELKP